MRNLKKLLAVIVAICVIATFTVPAFAASTISEDAQICADIGLLEGDAGAVDATYLAKETQRYQAAIIYLRLFGKEDEALAYEGTDNFDDADLFKWAEGKNILAYLYDNPELGWVGDAGKFDPFRTSSAQEIYKVLLTALGYKEDVDFTWDETLDFAAEKGLTTIADIKKVTNDDLAAAIIEALKLNIKDGKKTLVEKLVEDGIIDKDAAIDAGLIEAVPEVVTVSSVSADNLKQVVVEYDGPVEKASAENKDNYKIDGFSFDSASLAEDGKTVTLTLNDSESVKFESQKEYKLTVEGVKDAVGNAVTKADKVAFTPVDTTVPTVTEVIALGTKAVKVVFSEPVYKSSAATTARYKIDGKSIAGTVNYNFPNSVIIMTSISTGDHTLSVSDVKDYFDLKVSVKDLAFTVVEDTAAPEIVSAEATDLTKVVVEFNEPIKSVGKSYHTSTSKTGKNTINDTKVTIDFSANRLPVNAATITIENVEDYSGNKATRTVDVTPVLDTERPTVTGVKVEKDGSAHKFTITFSEPVLEDGAKNGSNYVIKDKDAKVVTGKGLNSKGSPASSSITYNNDKQQASFKLAGLLAAGEYTIEISGIEDRAYIKNTMIPYSEAFSIGDTTAPTIIRAWAEENSVDTTNYDHAIYIQYSEEMAIDGNGNALDRIKYNYCKDVTETTTPGVYTGSWKPIPTDSTLEMVTPDTVKITLPRNTEQYKVAGLGIKITLVSDVAGNFLGTDYVGTAKVDNQIGTIALGSAKATARDTIEAKFLGVLTNIDTSDFKVGANAVSLDSYSVSDGKTTVIFKLDSEKKLNADATYGSDAVSFIVGTDVATQDTFGRKVAAGSSKTITDAIKAESIDYDASKSFFYTTTRGALTVTVKFNESIKKSAIDSKELVYVKIDGTEAKIDSIDIVNGTDLLLTLTTVNDKPVKKSDGATAITVSADSIIDVGLNEANDTVKMITDITGNTPVTFVRSAAVREVD